MALTKPSFTYSDFLTVYISYNGDSQSMSFMVPSGQVAALTDTQLSDVIAGICDQLLVIFPGDEIQYAVSWGSNAVVSNSIVYTPA